MTGLASWFIRLVKRTVFIDKITPSGKSKVRTKQWPLNADLIEYFSSRALFKDMPDSVIQDYINAAILKTEQGYELSFDAAVETALFRNIPHDLPKFKRKLDVPATLITAEKSNVCKPYIVNSFIRENAIKHHLFEEVGHLFPLDCPNSTASLIKQEIGRIV